MAIGSSRNRKAAIEQLRAENEALQNANSELCEQLCCAGAELDILRVKVDALCAPPHELVVITNVEFPTDIESNGSRRVEVLRRGEMRTWVRVAPEVKFEDLGIGTAGLLSHEGNCLIETAPRPAPWRDVGSFERWVGGGQMLLTRDGRTVSAVAADSLAEAELRKGSLIGFDELAGLAYVQLEDPRREDLFDQDATSDHFSRLGGLGRQIAQIKNAIDRQIRYPEIARHYGTLLSAKQSILLHGPPGNGKTALARCARSYLNSLLPGRTCRFMTVLASEDYSMWLGKSEEQLRNRFAAAEKAAADGPVVMFFDEFDALATQRGSDFGSGAPDRILNTLLALMDGVVRTSPNILLIAATNRIDRLDPAVLRAGRFDEKIEVPSPNRAAAAAILHSYLRGVPLHRTHEGESIDAIIDPILSQVYAPNGCYAGLLKVKLTDGRLLDVPPRQLISGASLENVVRVAAKEAFSRELQTGQRGISREDLAVGVHHELQTAASLLTRENITSHVSCIPPDARPDRVIVDHACAGAPLYLREE